MKLSHSKSILSGFLLVAICLGIFSFSKEKGGDSFEIYLNGKLLLQQHVSRASAVKNLQLAQSTENDKMEIYYSHCGQIGNGRSITIKNGQNQVLKDWNFPDAKGAKSPMSFRVKEVLALQKNKNGKLNLYYSSKELPNGLLLASITQTSGAMANP